jgi:hypothetical protein
MADVMRICDIPQYTLRTMIRHGTITPTVTRKKGAGKRHEFSGQQLIGVAFAVGLIFSRRGCSREYARLVVSKYSSMPNEALARLIGAADDWAEEVGQQWQAREGRIYHPFNDLPEDEEQTASVRTRVLAAVNAIRRRLE